MRYLKLGRTGLDVSPIAIGAMTYGEPDRGHPVWSRGEAEARLATAFSTGSLRYPPTAEASAWK